MDPASPLPLHGDYEYLGEGYYALQEYEHDAPDPAVTCADALDAYVVPIALERVRLAGLPVPAWYLTNEYFEPPALLYGVNPFARTVLHVEDSGDTYTAARRMSRSGKFVVLCQELPPAARIVEFELVFGETPTAAYAGWAEALYDLFRLPLARVRLIAWGDEHAPETAFSAVERLPRKRLTAPARALLAQHADVRG